MNRLSLDLKELQSELKDNANPTIAKHSQGFFKTSKGQYGEGDVFLGIRVPILRKLAIKYKKLEFDEVLQALKSKYHEQRLLALFILADHFNRGDEKQKKKIYLSYLKNTNYINNWDLVDCSAHKIVGAWLWEKDRRELYKLASSKKLFERRISIVATYYFIKRDDFSDTLELCEILLNDEHDLIHKATGWMLREVGKKNMSLTESFLKKYYKKMPRTMLRYSIEKFPQAKRLKYLNGTI